jgi:hypothetical protein
MFDHFHFRVRLKEGQQNNDPILAGQAAGTRREAVVCELLSHWPREGTRIASLFVS